MGAIQRERERLRGRRRVAVGVGAKQRDGDNTKDDGGEKIQQGRGRERRKMPPSVKHLFLSSILWDTPPR